MRFWAKTSGVAAECPGTRISALRKGHRTGHRQTLGGARTERREGPTTRIRVQFVYLYTRYTRNECMGSSQTQTCCVWGAAVQQSEKFRHARKTYKNVAKLQNCRVCTGEKQARLGDRPFRTRQYLSRRVKGLFSINTIVLVYDSCQSRCQAAVSDKSSLLEKTTAAAAAPNKLQAEAILSYENEVMKHTENIAYVREERGALLAFSPSHTILLDGGMQLIAHGRRQSTTNKNNSR